MTIFNLFGSWKCLKKDNKWRKKSINNVSFAYNLGIFRYKKQNFTKGEITLQQHSKGTGHGRLYAIKEKRKKRKQTKNLRHARDERHVELEFSSGLGAHEITSPFYASIKTYTARARP